MIVNIIRELAKKTKGSKAEEYVSFVEKLKTMWEDAYYSNESNLNETKYSTIGLKGAKNLSKNNNTREYKNLFNRQKQAEDIHNNSTDTLDNTNIKSKRETGWYKTKYGDWGTLITDKDAKLIKTLEPNKTYRLEEILKHDLLYQAYPELKKIKVTTESFNKNALKAYGYYSPFFLDKGIYLNNYWINKGVNYKGTLLHEINHYIEGYEKYNKKSRGANLIEKDRRNNLGEIISDEAKIYSEFTQEELNDIIELEQMKENPNYKNYSQRLIQKNNLDFKEAKSNDTKIKNKIRDDVGKNNNEKISKSTEERQSNRLKLYDEELDDSSFSLEQRVSGDKLLDTQDLIEEIKSVGAKVDKNGYVTLYHQTTNENADKIKQSGKMFAKEPYVYFSTSENASQAEGRGYTKLEFKIPAEELILDDIFDDNADVKIKLDNSKELDVSNYIVSKTDDLNKYIFDNDFYEQFKYEDKTKITKKISELKSEKEKLNPDNSEEDWGKYYHLNTKIKALENGYDNEYDYFVGREKERLLRDYEAGILDKRIEEKKRLETKNNQLQQDIKESTPFKNAQYKIIQETNPMFDEEHVGIRSPKDIKTFEEVINDEESFTWGDYSKEDAIRDSKKGTVTIYSSYPIKNGTFVSTSYQQALDYAGGDPTQVHSRKASLNSVAWINGDEGQYAKVTKELDTSSYIVSKNNTQEQSIKDILPDIISDAIDEASFDGRVERNRY